MNNNMNQEKKETLLPPPELLERYESISKGLSKDLVELVKKEQEHRHKLQDKYLMHFRCGQFFGALFLVVVIYLIFDLAKCGCLEIAYTMLGVFAFIIILILMQYKKDKLSAVIRNSAKKTQNVKRNNYRRNNNYNQRKN